MEALFRRLSEIFLASPHLRCRSSPFAVNLVPNVACRPWATGPMSSGHSADVDGPDLPAGSSYEFFPMWAMIATKTC